jgi:cell division protein FtsB
MSIELVFENAQLKGRVIALDAEVKCLEAVIRAHERVDCLSVTSLKKQLVEADAENARLKESLRLQIEHNALAQVGFRMYQDNVDSGGLHKDRKDAIARLEAENARLKAEVERLRKLGTEMGKHLPDTDAANRAYIDFEAGGKS